MKKNDFILIIAVIFIALSAFFVLRFTTDDGQRVVVKVDGEVYGTYDLREDNVIDIGGTNTLVIKDNKAHMDDATCPDKLCIKQKEISKDGESILCLPNKVIVTVESPHSSDVDAVVN